MIRLIILGAGASVDAGVYPTGAQLIEVARNVISMCDSEFGKKLIDGAEIAQDLDFVKRCLSDLIESNHASVDSHISYIDDKNEQNFLKAFIISTILASNAYSDLAENSKDNWYPELAKLIFPTLSDSLRKKGGEKKSKEIEKKLKFLQIITFNYDVSLEIYLLKRVKKYFGSLDVNAKNAFEKICEKIFHVYGAVTNKEEIFSANGYFKYLDCWKDDFFREEKVENGKFCKSYSGKSGLLESGLGRGFHLSIFCFLVLEYALAFKRNSYNDKPEEGGFLSPNRIKVVNEERSNIDKQMSKRISEPIDLVYILGYGFDHDNNELLTFEKLREYKNGCFVTNFEGNEKLQRMILNDLLSRYLADLGVSGRQYAIPLVSFKSVSGALKKDFSLSEKPRSLLVIQTNLNPYLELKK